MINFCHILVSDGPGQDQFCEMTYLSQTLCQRLYPQAQFTVLTDDQTATRLERFKHPLEGLTAVDIRKELHGNSHRSRHIKTRLRELVTGDLVFLDSDALPLRRFDETFNHRAPFAAALDRNRESPAPAFPAWVIPHYESLAWQHPLENYFNSGVMFLADTPEMRTFSKRWHRNWQLMLDRCGVHQDQPSLNHTLSEAKTEQHILPLACNAMVDASPYFTRGAKILHYFLHGEKRQADPESLLSHLVTHLKLTGEVDWATVDRAAESSDAWVHPTRSVHKELATGHYFRAAGIAASRTFLKS